MSEQYSTGGSRQPATYDAVTGSGVPETDSSHPIAHGSGLQAGSTNRGLQSGSNNYSDNYNQGSSGLSHNDGLQGRTSSHLPQTDSSYRTTEYDNNNYSNRDSYGSTGLGREHGTQGQTSTLSGNQTGGLPETGSTYPTTHSDSISYSNNSGLGQNDGNQGRISSIAANPTNHSDESNPLNAHHRQSVGMGGQQGVNALEGETNIRRAGDSQNAPGKLGETGEAAVGALGFGGSQVGRPKEDQGIGEKIANFLGV
ncbi:hypothetical protein LTR10_016971 [Elasticomyces elasticus]|uniref:Uncharacterized protein n=1 Tax=Exophiala sideris TaxID=1016849 RepID=A0ABR0JF87_9EURO|nr:hypothetical protein LTR10_016971 [Elasticomyces elasticus]KAK5025225.1 hypothetical protein LTS07_008076 [Exophiala sideris]KAK5029227.1 hypothetical protein LTR13_008764 [Exophiala sideris]KAK5063284.1 hypothetical protein LTR69_003990 [Exophiala sideris]KAK5179000.1 hypothetical protein LTR44_008489 [Eurotiomycetes sp. CCFEE 6388]